MGIEHGYESLRLSHPTAFCCRLPVDTYSGDAAPGARQWSTVRRFDGDGRAMNQRHAGRPYNGHHGGAFAWSALQGAGADRSGEIASLSPTSLGGVGGGHEEGASSGHFWVGGWQGPHLREKTDGEVCADWQPAASRQSYKPWKADSDGGYAGSNPGCTAAAVGPPRPNCDDGRESTLSSSNPDLYRHTLLR